uniref:Pollen Ole e 1 allergen and extensin family protein n=1 Tax=Glycine max TaxID=3847 RepID=C6T0F4_SOYBN|nr:unknown [Glycine max]
MACIQVITVFLFALALAKIYPSTCQVVQGKVSCVDCTHNYDLSDIKVSVRCDGVKKLALATTENDGSFKVDLPLDHTKPSSSVNNCLAKLLGGPVQLYVSRENQVSQIIKGKDQNSYTISTSLSFRTSCPLTTKCKGGKQVGSSKTVDLPLPPEWGLAPSSYYVPFFPIIGIP